MGRTLSASTSTPIAAHAAIHRARSSGKAAPELKTAPAQPEIRSEQRLFCCAGNRRRGAGLLRRVPPAPGRVPPVTPINNPTPAQPETWTEQGLFCCAGNHRTGARFPQRAPPAPAESLPPIPINNPAPAHPEIRTESRGCGDWVMPWERRSRLRSAGPAPAGSYPGCR